MPDAMPTPRVDGRFHPATIPSAVRREVTETIAELSNIAQVVYVRRKLLILRMLMICNQRVGGSNPSASSMIPQDQECPQGCGHRRLERLRHGQARAS
jgi:hypothetical protein